MLGTRESYSWHIIGAVQQSQSKRVDTERYGCVGQAKRAQVIRTGTDVLHKSPQSLFAHFLSRFLCAMFAGERYLLASRSVFGTKWFADANIQTETAANKELLQATTRRYV